LCLSRATRGEGNSKAKLTKKKVKVIKYLLDGDSFAQKQIAKMFGVAESTISFISTGQRWGHVEVERR